MSGEYVWCDHLHYPTKAEALRTHRKPERTQYHTRRLICCELGRGWYWEAYPWTVARIKQHKARAMDKSAAHSRLVNEGLLWLGDRDDMLICKRVVGVFRRVRGDPTTYTIGTPGEADIQGVWLRVVGMRKLMGQAIAIEVKTGNARLNKAQRDWRDKFESVGGLYFVVRTIENFHQLWPKRGV